MKKLLILLMFCGMYTKAPAANIPWETISGSMSNDEFGWNYSYDIGFFNDTLMIDLDIRLEGATAAQSLLDRWESGIEQIWSTNRFAIPISFNIDWVFENYDQIVIIHDGNTGPFNMTTWNTMDANGWGDEYQEAIVAHEAGHMFGLWDEYPGGAVDPITRLINTGGLMQTLDGGTLDPYYYDILNWYHHNLANIPIPPTVWLFGSGLIGIFGVKNSSVRLDFCVLNGNHFFDSYLYFLKKILF